MQVTKVEKKLEQLLGIKERNKTTEMKKEKQNGAKAKQKEIAKKMLELKLDIDIIIQSTGLSKEQIEQIKNEQNIDL